MARLAQLITAIVVVTCVADTSIIGSVQNPHRRAIARQTICTVGYASQAGIVASSTGRLKGPINAQAALRCGEVSTRWTAGAVIAVIASEASSKAGLTRGANQVIIKSGETAAQC